MQALVGIIAAIVILGGGWYVYSTQFAQTETVSESGDAMSGGEMKNEDGMMQGDEGHMAEEDGSGAAGDAMLSGDGMVAVDWQAELLGGSKSGSPLLAFSQADYDAAIASGKLVVLYFYANWCPTCRIEFPRMEKAFDQLNDANVVGFRVNYKDSDTDSNEEALARKFGVAYQHTKVFVRGDMQLKKSPEGYATPERYLSEIKAVLATQ